MSNHHTRKTFFAKALAGLAGLGLLGGTRLAAKSASASSQTGSDASSTPSQPIVVRADTRAVARSTESL